MISKKNTSGSRPTNKVVKLCLINSFVCQHWPQVSLINLISTDYRVIIMYTLVFKDKDTDNFTLNKTG